MPHPNTSLQIHRRTLLGAGTLAGLLALTTSPVSAAETLPGAATASTTSAGFVLWGSSSANSGLSDQYPRTADNPKGARGTLPVVRLETALSALLGVPGYEQGVGGDYSYQTLSLRSAAHPYKPNFSYLGQAWKLPAQGRVILNTVDGRIPNWREQYPGTINGVPVTIQAVRNRNRKVSIVRQDVGEEVFVGAGSDSYWHTSLEELHRGRVHLLWTGKNNIGSYDQVMADTRTCFDVEPATSVVMGHWHAYNDRKGTANYDRLRRVNAGYQATFGTRYFDAMAALTDPSLWAAPGVAEWKVGTSAKDKEWMSMGLPPYSLVGTDNMHLNAVGNQVIAHGLARFLTGTAGLY